MDNKSFRKNLMHYFQKRNALLQICSCPSAIDPLFKQDHAKLVAVDELLNEIIDKGGRKALLWSFYRQNLDEAILRYSRYNPVKIDGGTSQESRRLAVDRFQNDPSVRLFIGNPAAAGAGLTLHAASDAIYMSFSNQAAHHLQSIDRIHRRGQNAPETNYHFIVCDGTIEVPDLARLRMKEQNQSDLLSDIHSGQPDLDSAIKELSPQ
jgi:SNF2 family DNA or RNA helicase